MTKTALFIAIALLGCGRSEKAAPDIAAASALGANGSALDVSAPVLEVADAPAPATSLSVTAARCLSDDPSVCVVAAEPLRVNAKGLARHLYRSGCDKNDTNACVALADLDSDFRARLAQTVHPGEALPRIDPIASNRHACELGSWRACARVADWSRAEACTAPIFGAASEVPNPALQTEFDGKAHALADKACDAGDVDACQFVGMRALAGCGRARDVAYGLARVAKWVDREADRCASGDLQRCRMLAMSCEDMRGAVEVAPPRCVTVTEVAERECKSGSVDACNIYVSYGRDAAHSSAARLMAGRALTGQCQSGRSDACLAAADLIPEKRAAARALIAKACVLGSTEACGKLGCHGREEEGSVDEAAWDETLGEPSAATCEAACKRGDDASCLVLGGAKPNATESVDRDNAWVQIVLRRVQAACASGHECQQRGQGVADARDIRSPIGVVPFTHMLAAYDKGCGLGSATACEGARDMLKMWATSGEGAEHYASLACEHGSVSVCDELAKSGDPMGKTRLAAAVAKLVAGCDAGELASCQAVAGYVAGDEAQRVNARAVALMEKPCAAGDVNSCLEAATLEIDAAKQRALLTSAMRAGWSECAAGKDCEPLCEASLQVIGGDKQPIGGGQQPFLHTSTLTPADLGPATAIVPELTSELLQDICIQVELDAPCFGGGC